MNKKFEELFRGYDLEIKNNNAYGVINGYETNAFLKKSPFEPFPLEMGISFYATEEQQTKIASDLRNIHIKMFVFELTDYGVKLGFNGATLGSLLRLCPRI